MIEEWRDIKGYEGLYQVSNIGKVKSLARTVMRSNGRLMTIRERILKLRPDKGGYVRVCLSKDAVETDYFVHRLVAIAFIDNPHNLPEVNHKDENKKNNSVDNLEWCTSLYNNNYGSHNENHSKTCREKKMYIGGSNPRSRKVICENKIFDCIKECAKHYDVKYHTMHSWLSDSSPNQIPKKFVDMGLGYVDYPLILYSDTDALFYGNSFLVEIPFFIL